jgi:hypothetical protein
VLYLVYVLLCLRNPQAFFELAPGENIDVVNVAYSADQAKKVFFAKFKQRLYRWKWLRQNFDVHEGGRAQVEAERRQAQGRDQRPGRHLPPPDPLLQPPLGERELRGPEHHRLDHGRGLRVPLGGQARERQRDLPDAAHVSAGSRFGLRWVGLVISYPRHADDFTCTMVRDAQADPDLGIYGDGPAATWEVNQTMGQREWVEVRPTATGADRGRQRLRLGLRRGAGEVHGDAPARQGRADQGRRPRLGRRPEGPRAADRVGADRHPPHRRRRRRQRERPRVRRVKLTRSARCPRAPSCSSTATPPAARRVRARLRARRAGDVEVWVPAGEVLTAARWPARACAPDTPCAGSATSSGPSSTRCSSGARPARNRHVDQLNVREVLKQLVEHYRIGGGSFDHYDSAELVQWLEAKKLPVENEQWSNPFQHRIYRASEVRVLQRPRHAPRHAVDHVSEDPKAPGAIYELLRVEEIEGHKIDHPEAAARTSPTSSPA